MLSGAANISIDAPEYTWVDKDLGATLRIHSVVTNSVVKVTVEIDKEVEIIEVYRRAFDITQASVDLVGFSTGRGLRLILDAFESQDGNLSQFDFVDPELARRCTAFTLATLGDVLPLIALEPRLFGFLRDLVSGTAHLNTVDVNCARALDGMKNFIAGEGVSKSQAWKAIRDTLNLSEPYLKMITDISTDNRHGWVRRINGEQATESARRSWVVADRFLHYLKSGRTPLNLELFPIL